MSIDKTYDKRLYKETKRKELNLPSYTTFEEILNAITHGIGALLAIAAIVLLPIFSDHKALTVVSVTIYSSTLFLLYIISTLYHALGINKAKKVFRTLDHCTIFLLIAGTYTPICLLAIGGVVGIVLASIVWTTAIVGVVLNSIDVKRFAKFSMICYISMGWCVVFAFKPLINSVSTKSIILLITGGIAYTIGAIIYGLGKKIKYMHSLWHLFVLAGSILHFFMVFDFIRTF